MQAHNLLGEPLWRPSAPKGFPTTKRAWLDGLAQRLDIANQFAARVAGGSIRARCSRRRSARSPRPRPGRTIARAESRPQALALLFMAPEFQRR